MTDTPDLHALIARVRELDAPEDYDLLALSDWDTADVYRFVATWGPLLPLLATALEEQMAENAQLRAERDMPCAHRLEEERLEAEVERLREALSANLESAKDGYMLGGAAARAALVAVVETARAALEGK